jgi:hypothetical protein
MKKMMFLLMVCFSGGVAFAQESAPPPVPQNTCVKPAEPAKGAALEQMTEFKAAVLSYKSCLENYLVGLEKLYAPYVEAGNAAAGEYNAYTKKIKFAEPKPASTAK